MLNCLAFPPPPSSPASSSTVVTNGPLSVPASTAAKCNAGLSQAPPPPRPSGSAWGSGSPIISGTPSSQHHQSQNSQTNAVTPLSSAGAMQEGSSPQNDEQQKARRLSSPLAVQQDLLTNHQLSSGSQSKGHERSVSVYECGLSCVCMCACAIYVLLLRTAVELSR